MVKGAAQVNNTDAVSNAHMIIDTGRHDAHWLKFVLFSLTSLAGTTAVIAPPKDAKAFWSKVPGAGAHGNGYYTFPCADAPEVSFKFGGHSWTMSPESLNMGAVSAGSSRCVGAIVGQDVGMSGS